MSVNVDASSDLGGNPFQRYLIPAESKWVRFVMQKAGEYSRSGNFITSRVFSVACSISATVLSIFNTISYLFQAPIRMLLNVVTFSPVSLVVDLLSDLTNAMLSFVFLNLGVAFAISGILLPGPVFTNFAPEKELSLEAEIEAKDKEIKNLDKEIKKLKAHVGKLSEYIQKVEKEIDSNEIELRKAQGPPAKKKGWLPGWLSGGNG